MRSKSAKSNQELPVRLGRREFVKMGGIWAASTAIETPSGAGTASTYSFNAYVQPGDLAHAILQGATDYHTAQFKVLVNNRDQVAYRAFGSDDQYLNINMIDRVNDPYDPNWRVDHIQVTGIVNSGLCRLQIYDGESGLVRDERFFRPMNRRRSDLRFVLLSCMNDKYPVLPFEMWSTVAKTTPDVIFILGDAVYADQNSDGDEASIWRRYRESRQKTPLYMLKFLTPVLSVWDDHDFGMNDGNRHFKHRQVSTRAYKTYFGWEPNEFWKPTHGVGGRFEFANQRFYLMDDRTWRDWPNSQRARYLGETQEEWLLEDLTRKKDPAWIFSGSQFFGGYLQEESYQGNYPWEFERLMRGLSKIEAPVVFGSGDVHFSELMQIEERVLGYKTMELTSSSIHSFTLPWHQIRRLNMRRKFSAWRHNFNYISSHNVNGSLKGYLTCFGKDLYVEFEDLFSISRG